MALVEKEVLREARRVLRRLLHSRLHSHLHSGAYLMPLESGDYGLFTSRNQFRRPVMGVSREVVLALVSREFLKEGSEGCYVASEVGIMWYRRAWVSHGDAFRAQHQLPGYRRVSQQKVVPVNEGESPLGWLRRHKDRQGRSFLSEAQYGAGEVLRRDFSLAQLTPRMTTDWTRPLSRGEARGAPTPLPHEVALAARQRFEKAIKAVGPGLGEVLVDVCCHLKGLEEAERGMGWPHRSGKVVLKIALTRLAHHYGILRFRSHKDALQTLFKE